MLGSGQLCDVGRRPREHWAPTAWSSWLRGIIASLHNLKICSLGAGGEVRGWVLERPVSPPAVHRAFLLTAERRAMPSGPHGALPEVLVCSSTSASGISL